ncbi:MAG: hypothetical protein A2821_01355 [Candidatus Magasanikbacteria bacterium RIFCSPHIGHO2_01_FULL_41_23]|uniref:DDH domain-containing protein n=1 Tax=Candidatus Magasanikbacteria bacterium RIFCSPLOWO2_01_FULL_40_15 TaxID=1798686 RepID=A0A1F6N5A5_9BACT|nr:MAG: hypothetical protein A2821_01355 [Candidatus Magasanikbacteria bacterium RIFCSPHIGHO2_01_FULL_41_23]OGH66773.1 MAG: hypothetical protein A3C66_01660 [Candidatus Magasanikbacteria bacterium RIFCSPHIGHO2_02_FULL_41_35]OGH74571.1 MAG: hypothetical protein A3F22_03065 [Candidatus Magasanikbacteria bacterium RIFCSPHIGHO2_12_FULL_41_16]OGH78860.1 MAG: hypothetical protein A2983_00815 [Candidatus Magasanikbacteria bacterium RIFCSPLOWO2_01_FULL_40_15]
MALNTQEQFKQLVTEKDRILITFRPEANGDTIGSATALARLFERLGKRADIVAPDFKMPSNFRFLVGVDKIKNKIDHLQKFILHIDVANTGIKELSYDVQDKKLRVFITPEHGTLSKDNIRTAQSDFTYDLIITINTPDLISLGDLYANNTDFFFKTPIVNIDNSAANEQYGQLNIVETIKSTTAELLFGLLRELYKEELVPEIANALLTGMIAGTNSFRDGQIRPATLAAASELVHLGADRGAIIKHLYQTKSIATFRLWGAALSHLQYDDNIGLAWSTITREDFARSGARENELHSIVDELITTAPAAKFILLLHEHPEIKDGVLIHGLLRTREPFDALSLLALYQPKGHKTNASFVVSDGRTLRAVEESVIAHLKQQLKSN